MVGHATEALALAEWQGRKKLAKWRLAKLPSVPFGQYDVDGNYTVPSDSHADERARLHAESVASAPDGWRKIGEGIARDAYLSPSGVIYKLPRDGRNSSDQSYSEAVSADRTGNILPFDGWRIPDVTVFHFGVPIVAMEYVATGYSAAGPDAIDHYEKTRDVAAEWFGLSDLHYENVRFDNDGTVVIIDLGIS